MKNKQLQKKIIKIYSISALVLLSLALVNFFTINQQTSIQEKIRYAENQVSSLENQYTDLLSKAEDLKKYMVMWDGISETKKSATGIKADEITAIVQKAAEKYFITNAAPKISSLPETLAGGIFNCKTISVSNTSVEIKFSSIDDIRALLFVDELVEKIPGYVIVKNFEVSKKKDYTSSDLIKISSGQGGLLEGRLDFVLYGIKNK